MKFLLAAYDPSHNYGERRHWAWHDSKLTLAFLNRFHDLLSSEDQLGHDATVLKQLVRTDYFHGGCVTLDTEWCCAYRVLYGGFDNHDRPSGVIVCAFAKRTEAVGQDWLKFLEQPNWQRLTNRNTKHELEPPGETAYEWSDIARTPPDDMLKEVEQKRELKRFREDGVRAIAELAAHRDLVLRTTVKCDVRRHGSEDVWAVVSLIEPKSSIPATSTSRLVTVAKTVESRSERLNTTDSTALSGRGSRRQKGTVLTKNVFLFVGVFIGVALGSAVSRFGSPPGPNASSYDAEQAMMWATQFEDPKTGHGIDSKHFILISREDLRRRMRINDWSVPHSISDKSGMDINDSEIMNERGEIRGLEENDPSANGRPSRRKGR